MQYLKRLPSFSTKRCHKAFAKNIRAHKASFGLARDVFLVIQYFGMVGFAKKKSRNHSLIKLSARL